MYTDNFKFMKDMMFKKKKKKRPSAFFDLN